jgi:ankyrin repeat domain-containing protein 50
VFHGGRYEPERLNSILTAAQGAFDAYEKRHDHLTQTYGLQNLTREEIECLQMLGPSTYREHKARNPDRVDGTCQWFLQNSKYISWRESDTSAILWVSADPGCGKSVLAKSLVDKDLLSTESRTTCYFFFKDDNTDQKSIARALCGLLHQIFVRKPHLLRHAVPEYFQNGREFPRLFSTLWDILLRAARDPKAGEIVCVLDALDECEVSGRFDLINNLNRLYGYEVMAKNMKLKFLITSRPYLDIERRFKKLTAKYPTIRLAGEEEIDSISSEIDLVIRARIEEIGFDMELDPSAKVYLEKELLKVTHRTYLWLKLIFELIYSRLDRTEKRLREIISTIPHTVNEAYEEILNKIQEIDQKRARKLLQIIVSAARPLDLREMNVALAIEEGNTSIGDLDLEPEATFQTTVRNLCGLFVCVIDSKIYFIHQTAREFLISKNGSTSPERPGVWKNSVDLTESNHVLAEICIWYLMFDTFEDQPLEAHDESESATKAEIDGYCHEHQMLDYAAKHWALHFRHARVKAGSALFQSSLAVCDTSTKRFATWFEVGGTLKGLEPRHCTPLALAAHFGHDEVVKLLLNSGVDPGLTNRTPLLLAAKSGYDAVVKLLLANGERIDLEISHYGSPLSGAVQNGHSAVVGLLLERGAKVNWKFSANKALLGKAARSGYDGVVNLLLGSGADIGSRDPHGRSPLLLASLHNREAVIKVLVEKGADITSRDRYGGTPLGWARIHQSETTFMLMLENDKGINSDLESWKGIFAWAIEHNRPALVKQLLKKGIDPNFSDSYYGTPLILAARARKDEIIKLLLEKGAVVNLRDSRGRTALFEACGTGNEGTVKLLLEKKSGVDLKDANEITPLSKAAADGHTAVVQMLLEFHAEVNSKDKNGQTPLHHAVRSGHEILIPILIESGANTNSKDEERCTPLWYAIGRGSEVIVTLLLKNGADANSEGEKSQQPLLLATKCRNVAIMEMLLENGADVNSEGVDGQTPLLQAAIQGHQAKVRLLLKHKADVNSEDAVGRTPLWYAVERGHSTVVELLLENGAKAVVKDSRGNIPYVQAVLHGHMAVVEQCLEIATTDELDMNPDICSTLVTWAASNGLEAVLKVLLKKGANSDSPDPEYGRTPISWSASGGHEAIVNLLIGHGASVNTKDRSGKTASWHASSGGHEAVVRLLLDHGASVDSKDDTGRTALWQAAKGGYASVVKLLLERGARADPKDHSKKTALWQAASGGHEAVVDLLIQHRVRTDSMDTELHRTPLLLAAWHGCERVVELLLKAGGDVDSKDRYQRTPLFWTAYFGNMAMAAILLENGANIDSRDICGQTPLLCAIERG